MLAAAVDVFVELLDQRVEDQRPAATMESYNA